MENNKVLSIKKIGEAFCPKCGIFYKELDMNACRHCNTTLNFTESYLVSKKCSACGSIVNAPPSYFEQQSITPCCGKGVLETMITFGETPSFSIDGKFNGANRGKIIKEKNEQLKKKNAGYSYENPESIRDKTHKRFEEKQKGVK